MLVLLDDNANYVMNIVGIIIKFQVLNCQEIFWRRFWKGVFKQNGWLKKSLGSYKRGSIKYFFSKSDQNCKKLWIWSHLIKKALMKNFIFCPVRN